MIGNHLNYSIMGNVRLGQPPPQKKKTAQNALEIPSKTFKNYNEKKKHRNAVVKFDIS